MNPLPGPVLPGTCMKYPELPLHERPGLFPGDGHAHRNKYDITFVCDGEVEERS